MKGYVLFFFFQAEDGIRDIGVTGVQTCALPIYPECDVVVGGKDVSRRHASIRPSLQGYVLTDLGANGTYVNGRRVEAAQVLGMRDVVRIGDEEFVFEADAGTRSEERRVGIECRSRWSPYH